MSSSNPSGPSRWVILDDSDDRLQYTGIWSEIDGKTFDNLGNFGPTYRGEMHTTTEADAAFSLKFNGTSVFLQGTAAPMGAPSFVQGVTWECLLDGNHELGVNANSGLEPLNNFIICAYDNLSPGEHTFGAKVTSSGQSFYVDRLGYVGSPSTAREDEILQVDYTDPEINYSDSSWRDSEFLGYHMMYTNQPESSVSLEFTGTSVAWYAIVADPALNTSRASYQLDDKDPIPFDIPGNLAMPQLFQKYFETPKLESTSHKLTVMYQGTPGAMPLSLTYLEIIGVAGTTTSTGVTGTSSSTVATPTPSTEAKSENMTGRIVGGVVGSIVFLSIVGMFGWYLLRRRGVASPSSTDRLGVSLRRRASSISSHESEKDLK